MIHLLVDWSANSEFFLHCELKKLNINSKVHDIPNYKMNDRIYKIRLPLLYFKYFKLAYSALRNSKSDDILVCWNFTTSIALGFLLIFFKQKRTVLALNIIAHKGNRVFEKIRYWIFYPIMRNPNYYITVNSKQYISEYSQRFNIEERKFFELSDAVQDNIIEPFEFCKSYVFVGGEAKRDWVTLFKSAKNLPEIRFVCIAREKFFDKSLEIPSNVTVYFDTKKDFFYKMMRESSLVVIPLSTELPAGLIILLKATFMNKPIIATSTPSTRNYLVNDISGYLVPSGDHLCLGESIKKLYYDEEKQRLFTNNSLNHILLEFSKEKYTDRLLRIINIINYSTSH